MGKTDKNGNFPIKYKYERIRADEILFEAENYGRTGKSPTYAYKIGYNKHGELSLWEFKKGCDIRDAKVVELTGKFTEKKRSGSENLPKLRLFKPTGDVTLKFGRDDTIKGEEYYANVL